MPKDHSAPSKKGKKPYDTTKRKLASVSSQDAAPSSSVETGHKSKKKKERFNQAKPAHPFAGSFVDSDLAGEGSSNDTPASVVKALSPLQRRSSLNQAGKVQIDGQSAFETTDNSPLAKAKKDKSNKKKRRRDRLRESIGQVAERPLQEAEEPTGSLQLSTAGTAAPEITPSPNMPHATAGTSVPNPAGLPSSVEDQLLVHYKAAGNVATGSSRSSTSPDKAKASMSTSLPLGGSESRKSAASEKQRRQEEAQKAILARSIQQAREDARRETQQEMEIEMAEMKRKIRELEAKVEEKEKEVDEKVKAAEASKATIESHENVMEKLRDATVCGVCFEHLNDPHILSCGHIACKSCLQSWFRTPGAFLQGHPDPIPAEQDLSYHTKVCHMCRTYIVNRPARVYFAKDILEPLGFDAHIPSPSQIEQAKAAAAAPGRVADQAEIDPWKGMFPPDVDAYKIWDEGDDVFRCNGCCAEINDGTCEGCGREFSVVDPDEIPGIWAAQGDGDHDGDEEMDGEGSDGYQVMDEREGMFGIAPAAAVPRRGRIVVDDDDEEEDSEEDEDEGSMVEFIDRDNEESEDGSENGSGNDSEGADRVSRRARGNDAGADDDSGSSASDESGERYDIGPRTGAFEEAMSAARQGRADRFRQRREASEGRQTNAARGRDQREGRRNMPAGLAGMLDLMAEEFDDGDLTDEGGVHEDDMVGLRGDYPGFSDLEEDGDDLRSESDVDDRTEEEYEDSFIDDEEEDEAEDAEDDSDELESGDESEAPGWRGSKKGKKSKRVEVVESENEEKDDEESDAPSIGELRRRRLKNLDGGARSGQPQVKDDDDTNATRRPNRSGSSRRAIIISDDEE